MHQSSFLAARVITTVYRIEVYADHDAIRFAAVCCEKASSPMHDDDIVVTR